MGLALAREAERRGASVTVVAANVSIPRPPGIEYIDVETTAQLARACEERFDDADVLLMAAAVADYAPAQAHAGKLKKDQAGAELTLRLERTQDVLSGLAARRRPGQTLVGFAAEHGEGALDYGRGKLARKNLDAVIVNDIGGAGIGFDASDNEVWIVTADDERHVPKAPKETIAAAILDAVLNRRSSSQRFAAEWNPWRKPRRRAWPPPRSRPPCRSREGSPTTSAERWRSETTCSSA
jgi:phosphopantothenoylcysteine decarboxylase/phosphopantothenate--cysteine ligase